MPDTRKKDVMSELVAGIAQLTTSDRWQNWLKVQSRFHRYSFGNTLLIAMQSPEATSVAGFHTWRKLGRNVRKGEKAIWILAPVTRKIEVDIPTDGSETQVQAPRSLVAFRPAAVFDIDQTDGEELPDICTRLIGDDELGAFALLVRTANDLGYRVELDELPGGVNGDCTYDLRRIRVEARSQPAQQVKTLAHEIAHAILHQGFGDRPLAELEAESVAYIVCDTLGIDSSEYSFGYVTTWSGGGDEAVARIRTSGARIQKTAASIVESLRPISIAT